MRIRRFFETARHLRPGQAWGRVTFWLWRPRPDLAVAPPRRKAAAALLTPPSHPPALLGPECASILNRKANISSPRAWEDRGAPRLWLYNLHYFDDLNAEGAAERAAWHRGLIARWVLENPAGKGTGWEPYPVSRRIVNWIRWALAGNVLPAQAVESLGVQARWLVKRVERHLLGNHLLANGKALLFAGWFFSGPEADEWKMEGEAILEVELAEQVLTDGGHFERSPMYHAIVLEDILDCLDLLRAFEAARSPLASLLATKAAAMSGFLQDIIHPDGEIPFFNDSAFDVAPVPASLLDYARRLGVAVPSSTQGYVVAKPDFGLWALTTAPWRMLVDAGAIGPDYLPGHAHCDTLSFELSVAGARLAVNSGVFAYEGPQRALFRGTAAHNTVQVDSEEQHEIWASFRVARRGRPFDIFVEAKNGRIAFRAALDGYRRLKGKPVHRRSIAFDKGAWTVEDSVVGKGSHEAASFLHIHPDWQVASASPGKVTLCRGDLTVEVTPLADGRLQTDTGEYSPSFGVKVSNPRLVVRAGGPLPITLGYRIALAEPRTAFLSGGEG